MYNTIERKTDRQERIPHFSQEAIKDTKIAVIGAGATGNEVLKCLALTGFRYVFITDMDHISTSNLSRTVLFNESDVGKRKAVTAADRFCGMCIDDSPAADYFDGDLCHGLGEGVIRHCDIVIGCVDNDQTRLFVSNICQLLGKPYIDTGIGGLNWNVFPTSGKEDCPCYACTLSQRQEARALNRIRNSCDVTRRKAASVGHVPTIGVSASAAAALAVQEAIKISQRRFDPESKFCYPRYGVLHLFDAAENVLKNIKFDYVRHDCEHHDSYDSHGGVSETPMSAHWKLKDALLWVREHYEKQYAMALYKDNVCADRSFITSAFCVHCEKEIPVFRPQPLQDEDLLCTECRSAGNTPILPSNATIKNWFADNDETRLLEMTLLELGVPLMHILEFAPEDGQGDSLYLELTGDIDEVMPNLSK